MDIPEISMISDFEAGMKCLRNPSLISRFYPFSGVAKVTHVYSFWKWGALFFAIFATFNSIIKRLIKLIIVHFHRVKPQLEQVFDFEEEDDDDDVSLESSDDDQDEEGDDNSPTTSFPGQIDDDFCVKGSLLSFKSQWQNGNFRLRRRPSFTGCWSEFTSGKNVVKLWDSLGLSLDFDEDLINRDSGSVVSMWDSDQSEYSGGEWNMPSVVLTADGNGKGNGVVLSGYDKRMPHRIPALLAEWRSTAADIGGVAASGIGKVYVRDDVTGVVTVGDLRNVRVPLETVSESDGDTWWDADAVIMEDDFENFR